MPDNKSVWAPIDVRNWISVPAIVGRVADESDVREGRAVFYLKDASEFAASKSLFLPRCAWLRSDGTTSHVPIVVIQAEKADEKTYIGYRDLVGGNGICTIEEVEFIDAPDALFFTK
jgi:hypothetical protein